MSCSFNCYQGLIGVWLVLYYLMFCSPITDKLDFVADACTKRIKLTKSGCKRRNYIGVSQKLNWIVVIYDDTSSCNNSLILTIQQAASLNGTTIKINVTRLQQPKPLKEKQAKILKPAHRIIT